MSRWFSRFATRVSQLAGRPGTFLLALAIVMGWALAGPVFQFSDTWQLVINTGTTIITFLMVFVIQHSQNRDGLALQAKLDELLHAVDGARDDLERLEDQTPEEIEAARR